MRTARAVLAALAVLAPGGAAAQQVLFSPAATEACLARADHKADCIGASAEACMAATEGGYSTVGTTACQDRELGYWDGRLNAAYQALLSRHQAEDKETRALGLSGPLQADSLREMQRAWIPYRDAACAYELSAWAGGSGGGPAHLGCLMRLTGQQALALEARLEGQ
jgi:uncharacterized protein YecT (DUF1311 family)